MNERGDDGRKVLREDSQDLYVGLPHQIRRGPLRQRVPRRPQEEPQGCLPVTVDRLMPGGQPAPLRDEHHRAPPGDSSADLVPYLCVHRAEHVHLVVEFRDDAGAWPAEGDEVRVSPGEGEAVACEERGVAEVGAVCVEDFGARGDRADGDHVYRVRGIFRRCMWWPVGRGGMDWCVFAVVRTFIKRATERAYIELALRSVIRKDKIKEE